ncbi:hypothetical protein ABTX35_29385 [Streptomyces sp. NPDC096080]|uniref:hypothetical protein n=1 Tax=Streptomyces sp. NPDC096080 TaxID=3156693 RepID=UPI003322ED43
MHPLAVEQRFLEKAGRIRGWGVALLILAALCWVYAVWQVLVPYGSTYQAIDCPAPVNAEPRDLYVPSTADRHNDALQCASDRNWPGPLAALAFSVPLSATGAALVTAGTAAVWLRSHDQAVRQAT